ncbi:MAG: ABC transporter permease [Thermoproteota archaeon]
MTSYIVRRLLIGVFTLLSITFIVFALVSLAPGDPIRLMLATERITPELAAKMVQYYNLDKPWYVQYGKYLTNLVHGDLGYSLTTRNRVSTSIASVFPNTLLLAFASMLVAVTIAIPLGAISAVYRNSFADYISLVVALIGVSMPNFWLGLLLILFFGLRLKWLPIFGIGRLSKGLWDVVNHLVLPSVTLGTGLAGLLTRLTRSSLLDILGHDFVRTARAKGLSEGRVLAKHVFRNALIPIITTIGIQFGSLLGGAMIVETIFAWPGMGRLAIQAVQERDYPVIQGTTLVFATCFILVTLIVDILYAVIDPRIRYD